MGFDAYDIAIHLIRVLKAIIDQIRTEDPDLAKQLKKAATSIPLNVAEARKRFGRDRKHMFTIALGSAGEVRAALDVALAWEYVAAEKLEEGLELLDREIAILYRLGGP